MPVTGKRIQTILGGSGAVRAALIGEVLRRAAVEEAAATGKGSFLRKTKPPRPGWSSGGPYTSVGKNGFS